VAPIPNPAHPFVRDAHFRKWAWADEQGWIKYTRLPFTKQAGWTKYPGNPIFEGSGVAGAFDRYGASYPNVIRLGGYYYLFYGGVEELTGIPKYGLRIGVARSKDGITGWERYAGNPILEPVAGTWESVYVRINSVYYDEEADRLKLFYQGYDGTLVCVGYAYRDGKDPFGTWTKYPGNPVIKEATHRTCPGILRFCHLRYLTVTPSTRDQFMVYTSVDDINWEYWGAILSKGAAGEWDDVVIDFLSTFWNLGVWYCIYSGYDGANWRIGMATSYSGFRTFDKWPYNPVLDLGATGEWDERSVLSSILLMIENEFRMYYTGRDADDISRIGLATIP